MKFATLALIGVASAGMSEKQIADKIEDHYDQCFAKRKNVEACFKDTMGAVIHHSPEFKAMAMKCKKDDDCWGKLMMAKQCGRNLIKKCKDDKKCWFMNTHKSIACLIAGKEEELFLF